MPTKITVLRYVTATHDYDSFCLGEIETRLFKTTDEAETFILNLAKEKYLDADLSVFESIESLDDYLDEIYNYDRPTLIFDITEIDFDMSTKITVLQYLTAIYDSFHLSEIEIRLFKATDDAKAFILELAKERCSSVDPDVSSDVFENTESLDNYLEEIYDCDRPILMYEITEVDFEV